MSASSDRTSSPLAGVALFCLSVFLFSVGDVVFKHLAQERGFDVLQIMAVRSAAAVLVMLPFMLTLQGGRHLCTKQPLMLVFRGLVSAANFWLFVTAYSLMPLPDGVAISMVAPVMAALLAVLLLGERIGWRRGVAIAVGFLGVLIILRPGGGVLSAPALLAVAGTVCFALMAITSRVLSRTDSTMGIVFYYSVALAVFGGVFMPWLWKPVWGWDLALMVGIGSSATLAHVCLTQALKLAPVATVVPFQYTSLLWAMGFGWVIFGEVPAQATLLGVPLVVGAGIYVIRREALLARARRQNLMPSP